MISRLRRSRRQSTAILMLAVLVVVVMGCAGDAQTRATAGLAAACQSIAGSVRSATVLRAAGKLSPGQISAVNGVIAATKPACASDSVLDPSAVVGFVQASAGRLAAIVGGF